MDIKVLGTGCAKCKTLERITRETVAEIGLYATITKVEDIMDIMTYGIVATPALVIDGKVAVYGRIPSADEMRNFLTQ